MRLHIPQLLDHTDPHSAYVNEDFPYVFGQATTIRVWINQAAKGDRLCYTTFNPHTNSWTKVKESAMSSLIFLFEDAERGFLFDESHDLPHMTVEQVLHIAAHYFTTPMQKKRITDFLANEDRQFLMRTSSMSLVWLNEGQRTDTLVPVLLEPISSLLLKRPSVCEPDFEVTPKRPPGRPKRTPEANSIIGVGIQEDVIGPKLPSVTALQTQRLVDPTLVETIVGKLIQQGKPVTREAVKADLTSEFRVRYAAAIANVEQHKKDVQTAMSKPQTINLSAPHGPNNIWFNSLAYLDRVEKHNTELLAYIPVAWQSVEQQLANFDFESHK